MIKKPPGSVKGTVARSSRQSLHHLQSLGNYGFSQFMQASLNGSGSETSSEPTSTAPINNLSDGGKPLPATARAYFEPRFGDDFSHVRIHQDELAAKSSNVLNASAYTVGSDIFFGRNQFSPETESGKRLLAHELAHVRQNSAGEIGPVVKRYEGPEHQDLGGTHLQSLLEFLQTDEGERWARNIGMDRDELVRGIMNDQYGRGRVVEPRTRPTTPDPTGRQPMRLTPAQIISLMGDFYRRPEALANAPASETSRILSVTEQERHGTISASAAALQYEEITGGRYLDLASRNDTHFARLNKQEWRRLHEEGIAASRSAIGPDAETRFQWALFLDAAGGHYLTDAFAAGHLFPKNEVLAAIQLHLHSHPITAENPAMATYVGVIGMSGRMPQLVLKNIHDRMNREGFDVSNARDMHWRTFGDNYLSQAQETQRVAALAVFLSRQQIIRVRGNATAPADSAEIESLMPNDDTIMRATRQAINYIPEAAREVENLIYRNRALAPAQFGPVLGAIIESNISTIGHPGRARELMDMLDSARRIGVEAPIAPSFTIATF